MSPLPAGADATADLRRLVNDYWESGLAASPRMATSVGVRRYDALLEDNSPAGERKERARLTAVVERARQIDPAALSKADRMNRAALIEIVESDLLQMECGFDDWVVDPLRGPQVWIFNLPDITTIETPKEGVGDIS
jgi:uncharacterized protein (DUF885 family)